MIKEVFPGIFRMEIPLPESAFNAVNSYIIKGQKRNLMIDTGMKRRECREAIDACLKALDIDLSRTDFLSPTFTPTISDSWPI